MWYYWLRYFLRGAAALNIFEKSFCSKDNRFHSKVVGKRNAISVMIVAALLITTTSITVNAATITSTAAGGAWSSTATWSGAVVPVSTDIVVIATTGSNAVTIGAASTCAGITINSGATLTLTSFGLTVNGPWANNGTLNAGSSTITFGGATAAINAGTGTGNFNIIAPALAATTLTINTNVTCAALTFGASTSTTVVTISGSNTLSVTGTITIPRASTMNTLAVGAGTLNAGSISFTSSGVTNRHQITISTGTVNVTGDIIIDVANTSPTIAFTGTGTLNAAIGIMTTTLTGGTLTTFAGCTINYNGSGAQTVKDVSYLGNLTLSGSGTKTWTLATARTVGGNLTVGTGAVLTTAGNFALGITGATSITGTLNLGSTSTQTFTGNVTINNGGVWNETGAAPYTFGGNFTNNATTFTSNTGTHTFSGASKTLSGGTTTSIQNATFTGTYSNTGTFSSGTLLTITSPGTLTNSGTINANTALAGTGTLTNANALNIGGTCSISTISNSGTVAISGSGAISTVLANFTNTGTINLNGSGTIAGITNNAAGIVNLSSSGTITSFNNATSTSTFNISAITVPTISTLTATTAGNTVNYSGSAQTANVTTYSNLTLSGSGAKTFASTPTVNGILSMEGTATISVTSGAVTFGASATLQYNTATARTSSSKEWITPFAATGGVIIKNTGVITMDGAKVLGTSAPLTINSGATLSSNNYELDFGGNFLNSGIFTAGSSPIVITSTATQTISGFTTTGLVSMTKTAGVATVQGSINAAGLTINGSGGTLNLGTNLTHSFTGDISLTAGTLNGGSCTLNLNSATASAWNGTGSIFVAGTSTVNFGATGNQTLSASATTFNNLTISNAGITTFSSATTIGATFSITGTAIVNLGTGLSHTANTLLLGADAKANGTWGGTGGQYIGVAVNYINSTYFAASTGGVSVTTSSCIAGTWTGLTSTDWNTASNWCGGVVPTNATNVIIPIGGNQPIISTGGGAAAYCNNLTINSGASLTITGTNTLTIVTNLTNNGSFNAGSNSTVIFTGGNQSITGNAITFNNLSLISFGIKTFSSAPTINGFLYMQGTATISITPIYGPAATLQYMTATARTAGVEWISPFTSSGGVVIASTGTITLNAAKVFNASVPLYINPGSSLTTNNFQIDFGGNFTNLGTFNAGSSPIVITNTMATQSIAGFTTTGLVSMTKSTGIATFTGNVIGVGFTINGTGGILSLGTGLTHTFTGDWALIAGTVNAGSSTLNIGGNATNTGTFSAGTSTVNYNASAPQNLAPLTYNNLTLSGSSVKSITGVTVNGILSMEGTATASAAPSYGTAATLQYKGSNSQVTGPEFITSWTSSGGVKIENANGVTLNSAKNINANPFTIGSTIANSIFYDGGYQLTANGVLNLSSGTFKLGAATATSFPTFGTKNINTGTTVEYAATTTQTIKGIIYSNLTISGTGTNSKIADGSITVNGILNLNSANASNTQGCLDMSTNTLYMGGSATTIGIGDVTGIVNRSTFIVNTPYTFGNQYTTLTLQAGGTLPSSLSAKIVLTSSPLGWLTNGIYRYYSFIQTGGSSGTLVTLNLHYLVSELYGTSSEGNLDIFDYDGAIDDHGNSNFNTTNKWVGLSNEPLTYLAPSTSDFTAAYWSIGQSTLSGKTWIGGTSSDWTVGSNWSGSAVPNSTDNVIIPDAASTPYDPTLPTTTTIASITIQSGGILNGGTGTLLTITGGTGAWNNLAGVTGFNAGTSTLVFTNTAATMADPTNFYNVTVEDGAILTLSTNSIMRIAGTLSLGSSSTGVLNSATNTNTIEYNGGDQTIILPNGVTTGYSTLILSGTGTKTMPSSAMTIYADFTMSGTASATAAGLLTILGNVTLGSGTAFNPSTYSHTVSGNWTNNGGTFAPSDGTIIFNGITATQTINGTAASQTFYNLTIDKTSQRLSVGGSTVSLTINNLVETSGNFNAPATLNINGTATLTAGTFTAGATTNLQGDFTNNGATFLAGSGTINFNGSATQTISGANTFYNLTIYKTASGKGVSSTANQTVNGILYLNSPNHSATIGALDMGSHILSMGATATTTGTGDVTGIVNRSTFLVNTHYTFGNQFTTLNMLAGGTLPSSVSFKIVLSNSWNTSGIINRYYDIIQTGGTSATLATLSLHYLSSELNGSTEGNLDLFDHDVSPVGTEDQGASNYNSTDKWVSLSNLSIPYIGGTSYDVKYWTIGTSTHGNTCTWTGSSNTTNWNDAGNWAGGIPIAASNVIIPGSLSYYPVLPLSTTINSINIQSGGTVTGGTGTTLTVAGGNGAWFNLGTFTPGTSTVIFTNAAATMADPTNFYNVTVADGASLSLETNNTMRIAGTLSLSTTGVLNAATNTNTVEYNGSDQTVILPNGATPGYYNLTLSGTGTKLMPSSAMSIYGNFTISGSASATALQDISLAGNWNNSSTGVFSPGTNTITFNGSATQSISGINTFNNVTIYKTAIGAGVSANANQTINGILDMNCPNHSSTVGALDMGSNTLNMGASATTVGTGDVTGTVSRSTLVASTSYTFGNQYSSIAFQNSGALPTSLSVTISLGAAPSWKTDGILRKYTMAETGAVSGGANATIKIHFIDTEMNSNTENLLVPWTSYSGSTATEGLRSDYDLVNDFITISNVDFSAFPSGTEFTLGNTHTTYYTWTGNTSTDWNTETNWSSSVVPSNTSNVIIPNASTTNFSPTLPTNSEIATINIQNGGILNSVSNAQLTLDGSSGTWNNDGTFNPSTSTIIFANGVNATLSGKTNFYNITVSTGTLLATQGGAEVGIAGAAVINGIWSLVSQGPTIVNYNGGSQTVVTPNPATDRYSSLILSGSGIKTMPVLNILADLTVTGTANATAGGILTIGGNVVLNSGTFTTGSFTHKVNGNWTNNGATFIPSTGTINFNGSASQIIGGTNTTDFNTLDINNTAGVLLGIATTTNSLTIGDITANSLFFDNGYELTSTGTLNLISGTFKLGNSVGTGFPEFTTNNISNGTTVEFAATTTQGIEEITYSNLTISGTGNNSKIAQGNITVNGILNLSSANASSTQGCLDMGGYTLTMGESATTIGTSDVTGIVSRNSFVLGKTYSFGNQFTNVNFTVGPLPASMSFKIYLTGSGGGPSKANAINRYYDIVSPSADAATRLMMNLHYLSTELNGNNENNLDLWDVHIGRGVGGADLVHDHGRSILNTADGYVGFSNVGLKYMSGTNWLQGYWTMSTAIYGTTCTWMGGDPAGPTDWELPENWTGGYPKSNSDVIIPGGLTDYPVLPDEITEINSIQVQTGAVLNSTGTPTLSIAGGTGAWQNLGGTFNPGNSTVIFTNVAAELSGSTNFNNFIVASGANLDLGSGNTIGIAGALTLTGGLSGFASMGTTINYNGSSDQTILALNGGVTSDYYNLVLSNGGTKTLPAALAIANNFTLSGAATATASGAAGNMSIIGNFTNNSSGSFSPTSGTVSFNGIATQSISGGGTNFFNNLTLNNTGDLSLSDGDATVVGTLLFTNGKIITNTNRIIIGAPGNAGTITGVGVGKYVSGNLRRFVPTGSVTGFALPIGDANNYLPVAINFTGSVSGNGYLDIYTEVLGATPDILSGLDQTNYLNRKWALSNSGVSGFASFSPTFTFVNTDEVGSINTSNLIIRKYISPDWSTTTIGTTSSTTASATGLTDFGDFEIGEQATLLVSTQPNAATVCSGGDIGFTTASTSLPEPTIQWQRSINGTDWSNIVSDLDVGTTYTDFTTSTLSLIGSVMGLSGYQYRAVFTNINGTVNSNAGTLTVSESTITSTGIVAGVSYSNSQQTTTLPYTGTTGNPTSYSINWDAAANSAGLTNQGSTSYTFSSGGANVSGIIIPANVPAGTYNGILTIANGNSCTTTLNVTISIGKIDATILVTGYSGVYDGTSHGVISSSASGLSSLDLSSLLHVGGTTYTNVPGGLVHWTFDGNGNYNAISGDASVTLTKAEAVIHVTPYSVSYDGSSHTATYTAVGVESSPVDLSGLMDVSGTTHTSAGSYVSDGWSFAGNGNYNAINSTVSDAIGTATPIVTATVGTYTYSGFAQGPNGASNTGTGSSYTYSYTGTGSTSYGPSATRPTNAGSYSVTVSVGADGNYSSASSIATGFTIGKANAVISILPLASDITLGQALSSSILTGGSGSVGGSFTFTDASIIPGALGTYNASITFVPTDNSNYNSAVTNIAVLVNSPTPQTITWTGSVSTDWSNAGNWNLGITPTNADNAVIPIATNSPIINTTITVNSITIESGGILNLNSGSLTSTNDITVAPGASLIGNYDLIHGNTIIEQDIIGQRGYRIFANPFTGVQDLNNVATNSAITINTTALPSGLTDARLYNNISNTWTNAGSTIAANNPYALFIRGLASEVNGLIYSNGPTAFTYKVSGTLNGSIATLSPGGITTPEFMLAANPFVAPVNTSALTNGSGIPYYVYQISRVGDGRTKAGSWSAQLSSSTAATIPVLGVIAYHPATTSSYQIQSTSDIHVGGVLQTGIFGIELPIKNIELEVQKAGDYQDRLFVRLDSSASDNGTDRIDLKKFYNDNLNIYSKSADNKNMAVDARSKLNTIPLGISGQVGEYNFKLANNSLPLGTKVYLNDKLLQKQTELNIGDVYYFTISADSTTFGDQRFELSFSKKSTPIINFNPTDIKIFPNPASEFIKVLLPNANFDYEISVSDLKGSCLKTINSKAAVLLAIPLGQYANGNYILTIKNGNTIVSRQFLKIK